MARLDDSGNLDYGDPSYAAPTFNPVRKPRPGDQDYVDPTIDPGSMGGPVKITDPTVKGWNDTDPLSPNTANTPQQPAAPKGGADLSDPTAWMSMVNNPTALRDWVQSQGVTNPGDVDYYVQKIQGQPGQNANEQAGGAAYWAGRIKNPGGSESSPGAAPPSGGGSTQAGSGNGPLSGLLMQLLSQGSSTLADRSGILNRLMGMADQFSQPVTANDPSIKASTDAYAGQVGRSVNRFKKQAAERAYAEGVPTGAFDAQIGNAEAAGGQAQGNLESQLMRDELLSRRQSLQSTLASAGSLLSAQDSADLQGRIANMDAILRSQGIDTSNRGLDIQKSLGEGSLNLQGELGRGSLANQAASVGNQGRSIDNQNNQFYDQFGANTANNGSSLDSILTKLLLGG